MLDRDCLSQEERRNIPEYVDDTEKTSQSMFNDIRQRLTEARKQNKIRYDRRVAGEKLVVGDRVWLYVPVVKQGRTRKFATFWRGPYTVIGKVNPYNYRVQLIGMTKTLVVHRNRLKLCYGDPHMYTASERMSRQTRQMDSMENDNSSPHDQELTPGSQNVGGYVAAPDVDQDDIDVRTDYSEDGPTEELSNLDVPLDVQDNTEEGIEHDAVVTWPNSHNTSVRVCVENK